MPKIILLFVGLLFFGAATCQLRAQSINNNTWKAYIGDPINDTAVFHIYSDSSFITNSKGEFMVRNHCRISGDTLTILDYGTEEQGCIDVKGSYQVHFNGKSFTLTLIDDNCEGRAHALTGKSWTQVGKR